ncbi:MAG TPA: DUF4097 family beta strand repeat-containing protein [Pyrinomonadaceae bacterium]|nr:DUF4097 family beta strand repeat-containing protein [Pyrinomonadaceae bacterium]
MYRTRERRAYRVFLLLLVALAVVSSAMRDLRRLHTLMNDLHQVAVNLADHGLIPTVAAAALPDAPKPVQDLTQQFRWSGRLNPGMAIEIKGLNGDIAADLATGSEVEVVADKHSSRGDVNAVSIKVVEHAGGVTICAIYPTDNPSVTTRCEPSRGPRTSDPIDTSSQRTNVRSNDVRVDFRLRVPAGVDLLVRTVNGDISAQSLSSNVESKTVNGNIRIATSGYADAKTVNGEISARMGNASWTGALNFKTVNGEIVIELPADTGANVHASTFNGTINSDFPLTSLGKNTKRKLSGTIGTGGRELLLKTLNGSINLRRAS